MHIHSKEVAASTHPPCSLSLSLSLSLPTTTHCKMEQLPPSRLLSKLKKQHSRDCGFAASKLHFQFFCLSHPSRTRQAENWNNQNFLRSSIEEKKNKQTQTLEWKLSWSYLFSKHTHISTTERQSSEQVLIERDLFGREEKQLHRCLADSREATENADKKTEGGMNGWLIRGGFMCRVILIWIEKQTNTHTHTHTHTHKLQDVPRVMRMISELNKKNC
jgi:hypothetical protein